MKNLLITASFLLVSLFGFAHYYSKKQRASSLKELINFLNRLKIKMSGKTGSLSECIETCKGYTYIQEFINEYALLIRSGDKCPFEKASALLSLNPEDKVVLSKLSLGKNPLIQELGNLEIIVEELKGNLGMALGEEKKGKMYFNLSLLVGLFIGVMFL